MNDVEVSGWMICEYNKWCWRDGCVGVVLFLGFGLGCNKVFGVL